VLHPLNLIAAQSAFDELSPEVQKIVVDTAAEVEAESFDSYLSGVNDNKAMEVFEKGGGELLEPFPEEDREAFADAAQGIWKEISNANGDAAQANYKTLSEAIK
jgi:TRAP-type C4-dicarboxylate transport system substrate-binding protein